ncbi:MAG: hypothetical protein QOF01_544 [Thermomicrobiales bacterium]|nr:hypothetical protein [Thermomicrobiales bacterium]
MTDATLSETQSGSPPLSLTSFVGRRREVEAVAELLRRAGLRLVTLTGPGGVGKTRLALRIAEELKVDFGDGVALVSLAPVVTKLCGSGQGKAHGEGTASALFAVDGDRAAVLVDDLAYTGKPDTRAGEPADDVGCPVEAAEDAR